MPITLELVAELNLYISGYIEKTTNHEKRAKMAKISSTLNQAALQTFNDKQCIKILCEYGVLADETQRQGSLQSTNRSKFTETLYMVMHKIRRKIDPSTLAAEIEKEKTTLATLRARYLTSVKQNEKLALLEKQYAEIEQQMRKLVYLGYIDHLYELTLEETAELYYGKGDTGYEYTTNAFVGIDSSVSTYIPAVMQPEFDRIYLKKYFEGSVRTEIKEADRRQALMSSVDKEAKISPVSLPHATSLMPGEIKRAGKMVAIKPAFVTELILDLDNYTLGKTHGADVLLKTQECNRIKTKLNDASIENSTTDQWIDLLLEISELADKLQHAGTTCSGCTEVLYLVMHKLRREISNNDFVSFTARVQREKQDFFTLKTLLAQARKQNQTEAAIKEYERQMNVKLKRLACLGELDFLLTLKPKKIVEMYPSSAVNVGLSVPVIGGALNDTINFILSLGAKVIASTSTLKFEYSAVSAPYNAKINASNIAILPLILQLHFPEIYYAKYAEKLKTMLDAKDATIKVEIALTELAKNITAFLEEKATLAAMQKKTAEVTANSLQELNDRLRELKGTIAATNRLITHAYQQKKDEFSDKLRSIAEQLKPVEKAVAEIDTQFKELQIAKKQKDEIVLNSKIDALGVKIAALEKDPLVAGKVADIKDIAQHIEKILTPGIKQLEDIEIKALQELIAGMKKIDKQAGFNARIEPHIATLQTIKRCIAQAQSAAAVISVPPAAAASLEIKAAVAPAPTAAPVPSEPLPSSSDAANSISADSKEGAVRDSGTTTKQIAKLLLGSTSSLSPEASTKLLKSLIKAYVVCQGNPEPKAAALKQMAKNLSDRRKIDEMINTLAAAGINVCPYLELITSPSL